jgi:hypothetical protein
MFDTMLADLTAAVVLSIGDYAPIRGAYKQETYGIMREYLYTDGARVQKYKNMFKRAINEAFYPAFDQGLIDGGGSLPREPEEHQWIVARVTQEWGFVNLLFDALRDFKKESTKADYDGEASKRAEGYCRTLDGVYGQGKVFGAKNKMLTFGGNDGAESCATCQKLKGKRHRASWWKNKDLIIYRGNQNYDCGCWQCQHILFSDKGEVFTV